jgi:hypothetical protein
MAMSKLLTLHTPYERSFPLSLDEQVEEISCPRINSCESVTAPDKVCDEVYFNSAPVTRMRVSQYHEIFRRDKTEKEYLYEMTRE